MSKAESIPKMWATAKDLKSANIVAYAAKRHSVIVQPTPTRQKSRQVRTDLEKAERKLAEHDKKARDKRPVEEINLDDIESPASKARKRDSFSTDDTPCFQTFNDEGACAIPFSVACHCDPCCARMLSAFVTIQTHTKLQLI
jgi:hypothetical protein